MKKLIILTLLFRAALLPAHAQESRVYTLKQCVDTAIKNNISVKQTGLQTERDKIAWQQSRAWMLPDLNGNFNYGWNQGRTIDPFTNIYINQQLSSSGLGLSSNLLLFSGLQVQNSIKQNAYRYEASKQDWEQAKDNLTLNVLLNYLQALSNEDLVAIAKNQAEVTGQQASRMETLVREGAVGQFQLSDLKGQLASDEINVVNNNNALQTARLNLFQLMNLPHDRLAKLDRSWVDETTVAYPLTADQVYQEALQQFAQVRAAELRVKGAEKNVQVQKGAYYPTLSFGANLNTNYSSAATSAQQTGTSEVETGDYIRLNNNNKINVLSEQPTYVNSNIPYTDQMKNNLGRFFGFNLQIPIFNQFRTYNQVKLSKINLKDAALENDRVKLVLRQNIDQAYQNMIATFDRFQALQRQVAEFEISFRAAEIRFNAGAINSVDYLLVKNNYDRARINLLQSKYECIFRNKILDYFRGQQFW